LLRQKKSDRDVQALARAADEESGVWVVALEFLELGGQRLHVSFQFAQAFQEAGLSLASSFPVAPFKSIGESLKPITDYFVAAVETVRANKQLYAAAEGRARANRPPRPPWFDVFSGAMTQFDPEDLE
jgi:hypothetical protein